jgi:tetratricopeptide (TPR) repeat protein
MGEQDKLSTTAAYLARALTAQKRYEEAEVLTVASEHAASADDLASQAIWRGTRARVLARRDEQNAAEALAREAVRLSKETDLLAIQADALVDLADVLAELGQRTHASAALDEATTLYESKGHAVGAARTRSRLDELAAHPFA